MINLKRFCVACRRPLPIDLESAIVIGNAKIKWNKKQQKFQAKMLEIEYEACCDTCSDKFVYLIGKQHDKGVQVI